MVLKPSYQCYGGQKVGGFNLPYINLVYLHQHMAIGNRYGIYMYSLEAGCPAKCPSHLHVAFYSKYDFIP